MLDNLKKYHIKLASNSPRRRELLAGLGIEFETKVLPGIDESYPDTLKGEEISLYIAARRQMLTALPCNRTNSSLQPTPLFIWTDWYWANHTMQQMPPDAHFAFRTYSSGNYRCLHPDRKPTAQLCRYHRSDIRYPERRRNQLLCGKIPPHGQSRLLRHPRMDRLYRSNRTSRFIL